MKSGLSAAPPSYQPQLDSWRAIAILGVLVHHFKGPFHELTGFGPLGVRFFFVLSAFLATRSLLKIRSKVDEGTTTPLAEFLTFEKRRFIRLLPPYYLFLAIGALLALPPVRETLIWTIPFLTNFQMIVTNDWPAATSHFWYLAVQEQCYLVWPWLLFFLPKTWLKSAFFGIIAGSLAFRLWCIFSGATEATRWFHPFGNMDSFAVGGLLALWSVKYPALIEKTPTRIWTGVLAALGLYLAHKLRAVPLENPITIVLELLNAAGMGWIIASSLAGFRGVVGTVLNWTPLIWIGKISYGIYVYHILVSILTDRAIEKLGYSWISNDFRFFVLTLLSVLAAALSWYFMEIPITKFRKRQSV